MKKKKHESLQNISTLNKVYVLQSENLALRNLEAKRTFHDLKPSLKVKRFSI